MLPFFKCIQLLRLAADRPHGLTEIENMKRIENKMIFEDPLEWVDPSDTTNNPEEAKSGKWLVLRGVYGAGNGLLLRNESDRAVAQLRFDPKLSGWHEVRIRLHARGIKHGLYAGASNDRALRLLKSELSTEDFQELPLGPRNMTGAQIILDGSWIDCEIDSVIFTPCEPPAKPKSADKEVCGILDFADCPDNFRPMEQCAAEAVRVHAEAGFTSLLWKAYAVRCEYHTKVGEIRAAKFQPGARVSVGTLLEKYDTLAAAAEEAWSLGIKMLGWMRINNETSGSGEWAKFGANTPFHLAHPDMRKVDKDGNLTPRLSFAYPEVREYLCSIGREILDRGVDGLAIDVLRHPPMVMFDKPLAEDFIRLTGQDPRRMEGDGSEEWLRFRARAFTGLLRDMRRMMDRSGAGDKPLYVRTLFQPWRNLRDGCDVEAWMKEGIVDTVILAHHCTVSPGHPWRPSIEPMKDVIARRARIIAQVMRFTEMPVGLENARRAYDEGADGVAIYESNEVVAYPSQRDAIVRFRNPNTLREL